MARVGIDIDGVMFDFQLSLQRYLEMNDDRGPFPPAMKWEFYEEWGLNTAEFLSVCHAAANDGHLFAFGDPMDDATYHVQRLRDHGHTIVLITDRSFGDNNISQEMTKAWLLKHHIPWHEIHFTANKGAIPVDFMIDDKPQNYHEMIYAGVDSWLRRRPWNEYDIRNCRYVDSLHEYVTYVLQTAERIPAVSTEIRTTSSTGGQKGNKLARFDLIPAKPHWLLAELYGRGAEKYDDRNWERGYEWGKSIAALERHTNLFKQGIDMDDHEDDCPPDCKTHTGLPHLTCVAWHAFALTEWMSTHPEYDDRVK